MGCDIHLYREKKVNGKWITADNCANDDGAYKGRNYDLFGLLSKGVRREYEYSFIARGLPLDSCKEVSECSEQWGCDGHSHSYLTLTELISFREFLKDKTIPLSGMMNRDQFQRLEDGMKKTPQDFTDLYPYCQMTNNKEFVTFQIEIPVLKTVDNCLDTIINSFDGISGDDHRIVFWFDN